MHVHDLGGDQIFPSLIKDNGWRISYAQPYLYGFSSMAAGDSFLDYEFLYSSECFCDLSGGNWKMTRKNLRWAKEDAEEDFLLMEEFSNLSELERLILEWSENKVDLYSPDIMVDYLLFGEHRLFLVGQKSHLLYAVMAFDFNIQHVNFRFCVTKSNIRGLSDTARVMFYQYIARSIHPKKVNDGGSLDRESLYQYKSRLNPIEVNKIYTNTSGE